jgi:predicted small integral membrane protein
MSPLEWMAWTTPTALFFVAVFAMIGGMTVLSVRAPSVARKGLLPMATTRGDRLYIGLIVCAFIVLGWLAATDASAWGAVGACAIWLILVLRWG